MGRLGKTPGRKASVPRNAHITGGSMPNRDREKLFGYSKYGKNPNYFLTPPVINDHVQRGGKSSSFNKGKLVD